MNEKNTTKTIQKKPIQLMRERYGGISEELKMLTREQSKNFKKISESIKNNYKTIPEISQSTGLPTHKALWYVMAMKKYSMIIEGDERDGYYEYTLKEEEKLK
jgi:hypothetical protein